MTYTCASICVVSAVRGHKVSGAKYMRTKRIKLLMVTIGWVGLVVDPGISRPYMIRH